MAYTPANPNGQATSANSAPVVLASDQSAVPVSGSVSADITNASVPVTGTFYQATQPVSASSLPLPTGAAQDGTDNTGVSQPASGVGIRGWLSAIYGKLLSGIGVTGTFWQATQPVSGTFFQATQPVSGTVDLGGTLPAFAVTPTVDIGGTLPAFAATPTVDVGNFPATQPVSGTVGVSSLPSIPAGTAAIGTVGVTSLPSLPAGTNALGTVGVTGTVSVTDTNDGAGGTGIAQPTGGSGILGWLSGIYNAVIGTLTVQGPNAKALTGVDQVTLGPPAGGVQVYTTFPAYGASATLYTATGNIRLTALNLLLGGTTDADLTVAGTVVATLRFNSTTVEHNLVYPGGIPLASGDTITLGSVLSGTGAMQLLGSLSLQNV